MDLLPYHVSIFCLCYDNETVLKHEVCSRILGFALRHRATSTND